MKSFDREAKDQADWSAIVWSVIFADMDRWLGGSNATSLLLKSM